MIFFTSIQRFHLTMNAVHLPKLAHVSPDKTGGKLVDSLLRLDGHDSSPGPVMLGPSEIQDNINRRVMQGDFQDIVSCDRRAAERVAFRHLIREKKGDSNEVAKEGSKLDTKSMMAMLEDVSSDEEEVKRMEFTESILLSHGESRMSYNYLQFLKYFRYFLATNRQGTLIALIYIRHMNFRSKEVAQAYEASQCTTMLINLLSVDDPPVQVAVMRVLEKVTTFVYFSRLIIHLGGIKPLLDNLHHPNIHMKLTAGKIIGNLCVLKKVRVLLARLDAIKPMVCLLDEYTKKVAEIHDDYDRKVRMLLAFNTSSEKELKAKIRRLEDKANSDRRLIDSLLKVLGVVLCAVSKNTEGRLALRQAGIVSIFATLIPLAHSDVLEYVMSALQVCCTETYFRIGILTEGILPHLLTCLRNSTLPVKLPCTFTLSQSANEQAIREGIRKLGGLDTIARLLRWELKNINGALDNIRTTWMARGQTFDEEGFVNSLLRIKDRLEPKTSGHHQKVTFSMQKGSVSKNPRNEMTSEQRERAHALGVLHETLLVGVTELIWKTSLCPDNVIIFQDKQVYSDLVRLVNELPRLFGPFRRPATTASTKLNGLDRAEKVVLNCLYAISVAAKSPEILNFIGKSTQGIKPWIVLLRLAITNLIPATCICLRVLLQHRKLREQFINSGGLRILFAYVVTEEDEARSEALNTFEACLANSNELRSLLKPLINAPQTIVSFITTMSYGENTQIAALNTIAQMARDENTLAIMSDLGVIEGLARILSAAYSEKLKTSAVRAIAACSYYGDNSEYLGRASCIPMLAAVLRAPIDESTSQLRETAVRALYGVSHVPANALQIWEADICEELTKMTGAADFQVQEAAAGIISNMRKLEYQAKCVKRI